MAETVEASPTAAAAGGGTALAHYRETTGSSVVYAVHSDGIVTYHNGDVVRASTIITADTLRNMTETGSVEPSSPPLRSSSDPSQA
ncbi:hypothetical protein [Amycolatopsis circi]|uniref:hypothetical protein n=1 Tax=Amycolatopsis circi TaxID=871959 RepID=UPI000E2346C1|nr:hypothetical protein [Amycolatopsis circi]